MQISLMKCDGRHSDISVVTIDTESHTLPGIIEKPLHARAYENQYCFDTSGRRTKAEVGFGE
jgi:hypothetical protein